MLTTIMISVLITWTIMAILFLIIDNTGSDIAKYIIALPVVIAIYLPLKAIRKILKEKHNGSNA